MNLKSIVSLYRVICNIITSRQIDLTIHISCLSDKTEKYQLISLNCKWQSVIMMILYKSTDLFCYRVTVESQNLVS